MTRMDRKTCRDILSLTKKYDEGITFDPEIGYYLDDESSAKQPSIKIDDVPGSLARLVDKGLIEKFAEGWGGMMVFFVKPELRHYKAFRFDQVGKPYLAGFFSGIATTVIAGMILRFVIGLF